MSFSFGQANTPAANTFGASTPAQDNKGGLFGNASSTPTFGGFGAKPTTTATNLFSPATTASSVFGSSPLNFSFSSPPPNQTVGSPAFGQPANANAAPTLGFGATTQAQSSPAFGSPANTAAPAFGSPSTTSGFGFAKTTSGFNFTTPTSGFSAPQMTATATTNQPPLSTGFGQSAFGDKGFSFGGAATTTAAPAFGTTPSQAQPVVSAGFGATTTPNQSSFSFNPTQTNSGQSGISFGQNPQASANAGQTQIPQSGLSIAPAQSFGFGHTPPNQTAQAGLNMPKISQPGLTLGQTSQSGLTMGQTSQPGLSLGQTAQPGLTLGQTTQPGLTLGQTSQPGLTLGQTSQPGLTLGQTSQPGLNLGQTAQHGLTFGQTSQPGLTLGQTSQPSLTLGQSSQPSLTLGQSSQPGISLGQTAQLGLTSGQTSQPGLNLGQTSQPGLTLGQTSQAGITLGQNKTGLNFGQTQSTAQTQPTLGFGTKTNQTSFVTTSSQPTFTPQSSTGLTLGTSTGLSLGTTTSVGLNLATTSAALSLAPTSTGLSLAATSAGLSLANTTAATAGFGFGKTTPATTILSTAPSGIAAIGKTAATTITTASKTITMPTPPQVLSSITFAQLEESINKWTIELEEQEKTFINQATQINAWDRLLIANGEKIVELNEAVETVKNEQQSLEHELDFVLAQQNELEELLAPLEKQMHDDKDRVTEPREREREREHMYSLAENLDSQLRQMSEDLKEVIEHLNETNRSQDTNDPIVQIGRILNAHMSSMQWIDNSIAQISTKLDQLKATHDTLRRDNERSFQLTYS